jgi:formate-dependent nitrite reductase membrane component NrfD
MTYYLVGALVGLFAELYGASRGHLRAVHDYGLALVRLLTIPVLSGIAAVLGVVLTRLAGAASTDVPLTDIFSLEDYPLGIVVAAIFGLTPGLLLERLRTETNEYKEELLKSAAGTPGANTASET